MATFTAGVPSRKGSTMEKWLCIGSIGVAALFLILFVADFVMGFPLGGGVPGYDSPFMLVDLGGILSAVTVGYMAWNAFRDLK